MHRLWGLSLGGGGIRDYGFNFCQNLYGEVHRYKNPQAVICYFIYLRVDVCLFCQEREGAEAKPVETPKPTVVDTPPVQRNYDECKLQVRRNVLTSSVKTVL